MPTFSEIATALGPHRLADCFSVAFDDRYGRKIQETGKNEIPREFRLVHNVYSTTGFLGGDGIQGLLKLECRESYPTQLAELGFPEVASNIQRYLDSHKSISHDDLNEIERQLFRQSDAIQSSVGRYIQEHESHFLEMLPYVQRTLGYLEVFDSDGYDSRIKEILAEQRETSEFIDQLRAARAEIRRTKGYTGGRLARFLEIVKSIFRTR